MSKKRKKRSFKELFRQGTQLLQQGKIEQAKPLLERAHKLQPEHIDAGLNLSGVYILQSQFKEALPILEKLLEEDPHNAMLWTNLGAARLGNPILAEDEAQQAAITAFKRALDLNPVAPSVAYNIGLIYRDRQEREQAIYWFKRAIQANPRDKDARNNLRRLTEAAEEEE